MVLFIIICAPPCVLYKFQQQLLPNIKPEIHPIPILTHCDILFVSLPTNTAAGMCIDNIFYDMPMANNTVFTALSH